MNKIAYLDGYMNKLAFLGTAAKTTVDVARTGKEVLEGLAPYFLVAPLLLGAGAGLTHSKMTSPSHLDENAVQKALEVAELEEFAAELKRRKEQNRIEQAESEQEKERPSARTLHI